MIETYQQPVLIFNPTAGKLRRHPESILQRTRQALARVKVVAPNSLRLLPTTGAGDATRLAREAVASGADLILVLGGDGTVNEALNGMVHSPVPLGILPGGTANVLAMELGLGSRLERAIERLSECVLRRVSTGRVSGTSPGTSPGSSREATGRHFLAMSGAGLDAKIVFDLNPQFKARAGKLAYWLTGFGHATQRVGQFEVRIDGKTYQCGFALASRVRNYGGDLEIARGASLLHNDFEVVMFEGANPLRYLWYMFGVSTKRVQQMEGVHTVRGGRIEMTGDVHLQVDGEYAGRIPAIIEAVPASLTLLIPPAYK
ncbi:MAG TPA: diacylglycerol kinase family protein [Bryobacteraceae bacterium]|nr:diacylglycerol kinase family protein [Bryobacteraceae bacterium]